MKEPNSDYEWHSVTIEEVLAALETDPKRGLSEEEAARRLERYGPNTLRERPRPTFWHRLLAQFNNFVIYIL